MPTQQWSVGWGPQGQRASSHALPPPPPPKKTHTRTRTCVLRVHLPPLAIPQYHRAVVRQVHAHQADGAPAAGVVLNNDLILQGRWPVAGGRVSGRRQGAQYRVVAVEGGLAPGYQLQKGNDANRQAAPVAAGIVVASA